MKNIKLNGLKWNLNDIVSVKGFDALYKETEYNLKRFDRFFKIMHPDMAEKEFQRFIEFSESLKEKLLKLNYMPCLWEAADQKSPKAKLLKNKARDLEVRFRDRSRKIWHWMKGRQIDDKPVLDKKNAKRLFCAVPDMEYVLRYDRELSKHALSESEESIVSNKDNNGISTLTDLRTLLETEFEFDFKPEGYKKSKKIKTLSELVSNVYSSNPDKRKAAYISLLSKYRDNIDKFFIIYQAVVKDWVYEAGLRNFKSPISVRNKSNHINDGAVYALLDVCCKNRSIFQNYFRFKAKELKIKKLKRYDIYAPIKEEKKYIPLNEAINIVLETLKNFSFGFYEQAKNIIDSNHLDSNPDPGKVGGAFCATVSPKIIPYILINYTGNYRDILILAHELGHGIHSLYAKHHSVSSQSANLPLSETASIFCETLVFERLYEEADSNQIRKSLLVNKMADSYATILRQNYFVKFELEVHEKIKNGFTAEGISDIYFKNLKEQFGDSVEIDPLFRYEWAYIQHIVNSPFYCYAYNFGELLALALYSEYKEKGRRFIPKIEKILWYGGSKAPQKIIKEIGIDINSTNLWQRSLDTLNRCQTELEKI